MTKRKSTKPKPKPQAPKPVTNSRDLLPEVTL